MVLDIGERASIVGISKLMSEEIRTKIELLKVKMEKSEVGSVPHDMYREILKELEAKLSGGSETKGTVKLHVDAGAVCDGCQ